MSGRQIKVLAAFLLAIVTAGCSGYLDHNDTVSASAGDAVDANAAIQTVDPWPRSAAETGIMSGGKTVGTIKQARAVESSVAGNSAGGNMASGEQAAASGN